MDIQWFTPFIKHSSIDMHICVLMVYRCVFWLFIAWSCSETPWTALSQRCRVSSSDVGSYSCRCIPWTWVCFETFEIPWRIRRFCGGFIPAVCAFLAVASWQKDFVNTTTVPFRRHVGYVEQSTEGRSAEVCAHPYAFLHWLPRGNQSRLSSNAQTERSSRSRSTWGRGLTLDSRSWVISCLKESMENG